VKRRERPSGGNRETKRDISPEELHEYRFKSAVPKLTSHLHAEAWTHVTSNSLYTPGEWGEREEETERVSREGSVNIIKKCKQISVRHAKSEDRFPCACEGCCVLVPCA